MAVINFYNLANIGMVADASVNDVPIGGWNDALNVRFRNNRIEQRLGYAQILNGQKCKPMYAVAVPSLSGTDDHILYCSSASVYYYGPESTASQSTTHVDITGTTASYSASIANDWTGCVLGGVAVLNNRRDPPQSWVFPPAHTTALVNLPNWTATGRCSVMRSYLQFLVAMDITRNGTRYPYMVKWSSVADPGSTPDSWNETDPTELCGEINMLDSVGSSGFVIDGGTLRDQFIIYMENAIWAMSFTGGLDVFAFQKLFTGYGLMARNCFCQVEDKHFFVGQDSCYIHNGAEITDLMEGRIRQWFATNLHKSYRNRTYVVHNPLMKEVRVHFVATGSGTIPDKALIFNYGNGTWTVHSLPLPSPYAFLVGNSSDTTQQPEQRLFLCAYSASMMCVMDSGYIDGSSGTYRCYAETERLPLGGQTLDGQPKPGFTGVYNINWVYPRVDMVTKVSGAAGELSIYLNPTMRPEETASWAGPYAFNPLIDSRIPCRLQGRYLGVRFESSAISTGWSVDGFAVEIEPVGKY